MDCNVIIIEYNCLVQGFMIGDVVSIVNIFWEDIQLLFKFIGKINFFIVIIQIDIQGK